MAGRSSVRPAPFRPWLPHGCPFLVDAAPGPSVRFARWWCAFCGVAGRSALRDPWRASFAFLGRSLRVALRCLRLSWLGPGFSSRRGPPLRGLRSMSIRHIFIDSVYPPKAGVCKPPTATQRSPYCCDTCGSTPLKICNALPISGKTSEVHAVWRLSHLPIGS